MRTLSSHLLQHRRLALSLLLLGTLVSIPIQSRAALTRAAGAIEVSQNLSNSSDMSEAPEIATGNGHLGVVWGERNDQKYQVSEATVGGNFGGKIDIGSADNPKVQFADVAVGSDGTTHMVYANSNTIYYKNKPLNGSWSSDKTVASDNYPNPVRMAVAPNGTIWVVWRDADGTAVSFRFSDNNGTGWSGGSVGGIVFKETGNMFWPDVTVDQSNVPHIVWYMRSGGDDKGEIKYADWNGSGFTVGKLTNDGSTLADQDPVITTDGTGVLHIAWRKSLGTDWAIMHARRAPGAGWTDITQIAQTAGNAGYAPAITADATGAIYVSYSTFYNGSNRRIVMVSKLPNEASWTSQNITSGDWDTRTALTSTASGTRFAHLAFQQEHRSQDDGEIVYNRLNFGSAAGISADPVIENDAASTKNTSLSVSFSNVTGDPTQVRWKWDAAPTDSSSDSNGWQTFANPLTVSLPSSAASTCRTFTLFTQVKNDTMTEASAKSDHIIYDGAIQATVNVINPHLDQLTSRFQQGAMNGDSQFTRETTVKVAINNAGDCAGLSTFRIGSNAQESWPASTTAVQRLQIVDPLILGRQSSVVTITDALANSSNVDISYYYDPRTIDEQLNAGGPAYTAGSLTLSGENAINQTLSFSGVDVSDAIYQSITNKPFWGVWVAASKTQYTEEETNTDSSPLRWTPIQVASPGASFSVDFSLASGQGGTSLTDYAGTYYVYVKFLDGAGNPSTKTLISDPVTLTSGYSVYKTFTPVTAKK
ncbi:hypothetical protein F8S13_20190 [Chloroflexia bacterium SDU3-3]|nr:hypothetical protein F8S13_20190 [Chloroflexia bacterium SDU3-3]